MKEIKVTLYQFDELSDDVREKVIDRYRYICGESHQEFWSDEQRATLDKFCDIIGIKMKNWQVDGGCYDYSFRWEREPFGDWYNGSYIDADEVCGKYLLRFLNRIYFDVRRGKYHSTANRHMHSKWHMEEFYALTGYCADYAICKPIYDWHRNPDWKISLQELVESCLDSFFSDWRDEIAYGYGDEYVTEELTEGNLEHLLFLEDGTEYPALVA